MLPGIHFLFKLLVKFHYNIFNFVNKIIFLISNYNKFQEHVGIIMLSATVPNYIEFANWVYYLNIFEYKYN